jgi:hypothetical protein
MGKPGNALTSKPVGLGSGGSRIEWSGGDPLELLSNFGDSLKCNLNSIRKDVVLHTTNARDQLLRSCDSNVKANRRNIQRKRRVFASITNSSVTLTQTQKFGDKVSSLRTQSLT